MPLGEQHASLQSQLCPSKAYHLNLPLPLLYYRALVKEELDLRIHLLMLTSYKQIYPLLSHFGPVPLISFNEKVKQIMKQDLQVHKDKCVHLVPSCSN